MNAPSVKHAEASGQAPLSHLSLCLVARREGRGVAIGYVVPQRAFSNALLKAGSKT